MENEHILVIDDDPSVRFFVQETLRRVGYAVIGVASAEEALEHLASAPPILMVVDLQLAGMSGLKLLEKLCGLGQNIPAVVLTAHNVPINARQALALGAVDFVPKPCTTAELREAVRSALDPAGAARRRESFPESLVGDAWQSVDRARDKTSRRPADE